MRGRNVGETWPPCDRPLWRWDLVVCEAPDAFFIQFNAIKIAKRPLKGDAWTALEDGWKVTPYADGQIRVQLHNSEGVVVSLNGDVGK
jgi:hypothetical protein